MNHIVNNALKQVKAHAPEILTGIGVGGVFTTAILTAKATLKAEKLIDGAFPQSQRLRKEHRKDVVKLVWKQYIPPVASGAVTIGAIVLSHKSGARRTAAAVTAYSVTEKAFTEFKAKAVETFGEGKVQRVRDDVAQDQVTANPPSGQQILVVGKGNVLCYDARSCRYFRSSMEELKRAQNDLNWQLNHESYMSLSEYYVLIGLPITKESVHMGWVLNRGLMELDISTTVAENDEPCLVVDFNYCQPLHDDPPVCLGDI